ncbi:MAG: helix-turn-helix transcriptional regulator [Lachnospiraceae bacterium]|nr:helix-turn-helix transcriptional regulator [Lachnospiraceae bacterium]
MLEIEFIGYDGTHSKDFIYGLPPGHESYLLILTSTAGEFFLDGEFHRAPAGSAILYTPGSHVLYRACENTYTNDWIRFTCDESYLEQLPLKNQFFSVTDAEFCHNLIVMMTWESTMHTPESNEILSHLLHSLILKLCESCAYPAGSPHMQEMLDLHKRIYNHPELPWNVDIMADALHLSSGYLQSLYRSMFGSSCMEDVIRQRIKRAQDQLLSTSRSVREIAELCGYNNVEHFCRQFRKFTGLSPNRYRKQVSTHPASKAKHLTLGGLEAGTLSPDS